ncbi:MAG: nickel pincer cofactor biosynthesis protein LarB [Desulfosudaceae bacterium]
MDSDTLKQILDEVASGQTSPAAATTALQHLTYENIGYAHVDHHRSQRKGFPEVIFGAGKTADQICGIMERILARDVMVLVTKISPEDADRVIGRFPEAIFDAEAGMIICQKQEPALVGRGLVLVISAGTSDIPVAREAFLTAQAMGNQVQSVFDIGVAGIHRLFAYRELIEEAAVLVVVAGMEGALPTVVAGLTSRPVIAVPTSVGYGTSLGGLTALFGMLNSCSSNVAVVNIDNGFGAGYMAACVNRK